MMTKWALRAAMIASVLVSYNCKRRRTEETPPPPAPTVPTTPTTPQPSMPQPTMPQPTMPQPTMPQPTMPQPTMPQPTMPQPTMPGGDFITSQMQMRQQQFAQGMMPVMPLTRGTLQTHSNQDYQVTITPGRCYKIIGVGGVGVTDLDLKLYDPNGTLVDQDIATDNYPVIGLNQQRPLCPQTGGSYRLRVEMYAGAGEFGVQVFGGAPGAQPSMPQPGMQQPSEPAPEGE
ncbi:MAG: hypothetical protein U0325_22800 [Polyangiales bacterium]